MRIPLFKVLEIETHSYCNRRCSMCMRNNEVGRTRFDADDEAIAVQLPTDIIHRLIDEYAEIGACSGYEFVPTVCLSHYNEPLFDERIVELAAYASSKGMKTFLCTNGDALTPEMAGSLDGVLDKIVIGPYGNERWPKHVYWESLFSKTAVEFSGEGVVTHWCPGDELTRLIHKHLGDPCISCRKRFIVKHDGEMLQCCDDMSGHFDLGNVRDHSLEELWLSEKHVKLLEVLAEPGGRKAYPHCAICPRDGMES